MNKKTILSFAIWAGKSECEQRCKDLKFHFEMESVFSGHGIPKVSANAIAMTFGCETLR